MKTNFTLTIAIIIASMFVLNACNNQSTDSNPIPSSEDVPLTEAQLAFLETVKDTIISLEDIILDNGQNVRSFLEVNDPNFLNTYPSWISKEITALTPGNQKNLYIARMLAMGNYLVNDANHTYPSVGTNKPAQTGLAYSWGSKDYSKRQIPPGASGECKDLEIFGLDCSGMIWVMTQASYLPPPVPKYNFFVKEITNAEIWTKAFKASADYKDLKMKDMGQLSQDKMKNGDMILWGSHVGIYLNGWFYQSNGTSKSPGCNNNLSSSRGPRLISLADVLGWGLGSYKVFRALVPAVSGRITLTATISGSRTYSPGGINEMKSEEGSADFVYILSETDVETDGFESTANWNDAGFGGTANRVSIHVKTYNYICDENKNRQVIDKETTTQTFSSSGAGLQITGAGLVITEDGSYNIQIGPSTSLTAATSVVFNEYSGYCINPESQTNTSQIPIPFAYYFIPGVGGGYDKLSGKMDPNNPKSIKGVYHGTDNITMFSYGTTVITLPLEYTITWDLTLTE
ncbi:MAG: C40 family peptidase [Ignavibacteriae bacterium]|nr:C40 family peptidase [Ignavibacteriota bacterium]